MGETASLANYKLLHSVRALCTVSMIATCERPQELRSSSSSFRWSQSNRFAFGFQTGNRPVGWMGRCPLRSRDLSRAPARSTDSVCRTRIHSTDPRLRNRRSRRNCQQPQPTGSVHWVNRCKAMDFDCVGGRGPSGNRPPNCVTRFTFTAFNAQSQSKSATVSKCLRQSLQ